MGRVLVVVIGFILSGGVFAAHTVRPAPGPRARRSHWSFRWPERVGSCDSTFVIIGCVNAANLLRYARRRAGMTQRELGRRAGVPQPAIARIESGSVSPRLATLDRLLSATGHGIELGPRAGE